MIATISPASDNYEETLSTLKYASRAKKIENKAKRNEGVSQKVIRQLKDEIEELRRQLAESANRGKSNDDDFSRDDEAFAEMEAKIANLERAKKTSWEETQKLSKKFEEERQKNLKNENYVRNVMQTVKQENVDLIKRLKALQREKNELTSKFKTKKSAYNKMKKSLEVDMLNYSTIMKEGAETGHTDEDQLANLLSQIEMKR
jgi:kinesin family member 3A